MQVDSLISEPTGKPLEDDKTKQNKNITLNFNIKFKMKIKSS